MILTSVSVFSFWPHSQTELGSLDTLLLPSNPRVIWCLSRFVLEVSHRIIESLKLEKTSKIIKSNRHPTTTMPAKPCPEVPRLHVFWTPPGMVTPSLPWAVLDHSFSKDFFPNIRSKPPLMRLEAISSCPIASYLGEETNTHLTTILLSRSCRER